MIGLPEEPTIAVMVQVGVHGLLLDEPRRGGPPVPGDDLGVAPVTVRTTACGVITH